MRLDLVSVGYVETTRVSTNELVHLGVIPDGNRRYARLRGLSYGDAYAAAADKALELVGWCLDAGVRHLSAFGVSQENIARRPREEVFALHTALLRFCERVDRVAGARLHVFGDPPRLPDFLPEKPKLLALAGREDANAGARLTVHVGLNYSAAAEIGTLVDGIRRGTLRLDDVVAPPLSARVPAVDLVVRTGGQQRLSGFLPFQTAYAELWFTPTLWPQFSAAELGTAIEWYRRQERRLGE